MTFATALQLGRVSNLPTVWSNVLCALVLAGGSPWGGAWPVLMIALSLFYVGGMYLNDAFDREIDARERPDRPIPAGRATVNTVFAAGFVMLLAGLGLVVLAVSLGQGVRLFAPILCGLALAAIIVFYNWHHKGNAFSPMVMGLCRMMTYLTAAVATAAYPAPEIYGAALALLSYLIGLTYAAKQEAFDRIGRLWPLVLLVAPLVYGALMAHHISMLSFLLALAMALWGARALRFLLRRNQGDVGRAVVGLIAGISLVDALFLSLAGATFAASFAVLCFLVTVALQRWVSGT